MQTLFVDIDGFGLLDKNYSHLVCLWVSLGEFLVSFLLHRIHCQE